MIYKSLSVANMKTSALQTAFRKIYTITECKGLFMSAYG